MNTEIDYRGNKIEVDIDNNKNSNHRKKFVKLELTF